MKEPGFFLFLLLIATSFLIFFVGRFFYRKISPRWFKIKTFLMRFFFAPMIFIFVLNANFDNADSRALILLAMMFAIIDRFGAWADRNVPDSDPRKFR